MAIRFRLRSLFAAVTILAVVLPFGMFVWNSLPDAHPVAVRNKYVAGQITLEEAVNEVGSQAYGWVEFKKRWHGRGKKGGGE